MSRGALLSFCEVPAGTLVRSRGCRGFGIGGRPERTSGQAELSFREPLHLN